MLSVEIAGIRMKNPVMPASGTFSYGEEASQFVDISKLGAVIMKNNTLKGTASASTAGAGPA